MPGVFARECIRVNSAIVSLLGSHKGKLVLAVVTVITALAWHAARAPGGKTNDAAVAVTPSGRPKPAARAAQGAPERAGPKFDFYLLAMTVHAAFCADGHERQQECRAKPMRPLVIHGLWPENLKPRTYPHDCAAPPLALDESLSLELQPFMPGMADGLERHEWREHGGCSGLDDDQYYRAALGLARTLDSALSARLTTLAGRETTPAELREAADAFQPGIGRTFTLHCRTLRGSGGRAVLMEVRQCVDNDGAGGAPGTLLDCASVDRRDQGCGGGILIEGRER
jgi:ribonuclease T2